MVSIYAPYVKLVCVVGTPMTASCGHVLWIEMQNHVVWRQAWASQTETLSLADVRNTCADLHETTMEIYG
jgi:hypothetical protein